ncbi:MAG: type II toxin-antitoxin system HicB family antitoxin [Candidatus Hydrogenedentota bacterium]
MKTYTYTVHFEPAEEGGFVVSVPALPGCFTQGETYDDAVAMAQDAIECYLGAIVKLGEPIPEETIQSPISIAIRVNSPAEV